MNTLRRALLSRFVWILVGLFALTVAVEIWLEAEGGASVVVQRWGVWAPLAAFLLKTLTTMTPIGAVVLAVFTGVLFPLWMAILINLLSGVIGGIGMYYVWRRGHHEFDLQARMESLPRWMRRYAADNLLFLILLRFLPWAGGGLADMLAGAHRIPLRTQIWSLILGYLPGAVIYALMGAGLLHLT
jgi:uncharacterized membrane protein YdjX (TVP38/TMEM64 family)